MLFILNRLAKGRITITNTVIDKWDYPLKCPLGWANRKISE